MINSPQIFNWALIVLDKCTEITTEVRKTKELTRFKCSKTLESLELVNWQLS